MCVCSLYVQVYASVSLEESGGVYREKIALSVVLCDLAGCLLEFLRGYFSQSGGLLPTVRT